MEDQMDGASNPHGGEVLAKISNALVALHMRYYGKGPEEAKTYAVDDTIVSVLRGGFTTVEHTLIGEGRDTTVRDMREHFQGAMKDEFVKVVEESTGRKVDAYMSQIHIDPDFAVEIFLLSPDGGGE
jgi:uncharacterized protein YbcI